MSAYLTETWFYRLASALILGGFAMLCQPFWHGLFMFGFPVLLAGVVLFMILDQVPDARRKDEEERVG